MNKPEGTRIDATRAQVIPARQTAMMTDMKKRPILPRVILPQQKLVKAMEGSRKLSFQGTTSEPYNRALMGWASFLQRRHVTLNASSEILSDILRREWNWNGLVISDWGATNTVGPSLKAGMDLEMPGPPLKRTEEAVKEAIKNGEVSVEQAEGSARRLLHLLQRAERFEDASDVAEALPLRPLNPPKKLAIVGPNAKRTVADGGGSAYIKAPYWASVLESLKAEFGPRGTDCPSCGVQGIGPSKLFVDGKELASESGKRQPDGELFCTYGSDPTNCPCFRFTCIQTTTLAASQTALRIFENSEIKAGEACVAELEIDAYSLGVFDALVNRWAIDAVAEFDIVVSTQTLAMRLWLAKLGFQKKSLWCILYKRLFSKDPLFFPLAVN
ncbi:hypothetical protein AN2599.2 [Aspergillus nidulans FGSC A4]|uniref:beta-glucosidase n=1 Tax=Emericella nidulans (strain FGSC A4 / ATCC 38163 / CBS 112.46 / NRRL 194 / M139) TaxID=227321 RepID=Q5BA31_EMENI|nr:hypothetical protein [Aspergillus nidulans FGSC A4]EAA64704.1 hypothetical protein AN2599.2 [Aspergillus nidulans FGSC A4]CBF87174.1 TPA: conserved hypothetical protein [Aspergillus nidulans FGSC A4]|eukprot:XP_660203.1 hypothetical protein AN2599.2 [Aspergillus nidulans FGSC A4]